MKDAAGRVALFWLVMGTWTGILLWSVSGRVLQWIRLVRVRHGSSSARPRAIVG